jgi:lysophospholipase L1-like esterase
MRVAWMLCLLAAAGADADAEGGDRWVPFADPTRFEKAVAAFEEADRTSPPPAGAVVAVGSSSMRGWHGRIAQDLAPVTVIPRGFGGSNYYDVLHYADRLVLAYQPRAVLLYEGDNDVAAGIPPAQIAATFDALVARLRGRLPDLRIYVIGAKPSIARWSMWPQMVDANDLVAQRCAADPRMTYIDVAAGMLGTDGTPRPEIFLSDQLHMNDAGYDAWAAAVGPVLRAGEARHEQP